MADDLKTLAARHAALAAEVAAATREADAARRLLSEARGETHLPVLEDVRVAAPCTAAWTAMTGDDRARMCGECNRHVYNLSAMTREQATALIAEREGRLCVRFFQRADGTILTADCKVGVRRRRRRRLAIAGATVAVAGAVFAALHKKDPPDQMAALAPTICEEPEPELDRLTESAREPAPPPPPPVHAAPVAHPPEDEGKWTVGVLMPMPVQPPEPIPSK